MTTLPELEARIRALPREALENIVANVAAAWFAPDDRLVTGDQSLDRDKPLDSDHLEAVTVILSSHGLCPKANS